MEGGHEEKKKGGMREGVTVIGFIIIAILGMAIAIYAARFVPSAISGIAGAGSYISDIFVLEDGEGESNTEEEPREEEPAEEEAPVTPEPEEDPETPTTPRPTTPVYSGLSDLTVNIASVGYCTTGAQNSFVASSRVPENARYGGVRFTVTNIGTNISGAWSFRIDTASSPSDTYEYNGQASLAPTQSAVGTVCFPRGVRENDGEVTLTVDARNQIAEINESNNTDSEDLTILEWD